MAEVQIATVRNQVLLSLFTDFENFSVFKPGPQQETVGQRHAGSAHRVGRRTEDAPKMKGLFPVRLGKANSPSDSQGIDMLSNNEKLIAVVGATGQQGGAVVRALMFVAHHRYRLSRG